MTGVRAVSARAARARIDACLTALEAVAQGDEAVVLCASRAAADELAYEITRARGATFGLHKKTLAGLASEIAAPVLAKSGLSIASWPSIEAVARRVVGAALDAGALPTFGRPGHDGASAVAVSPSFSIAVAETVSDLRLARVAPSAVIELGGGPADVGALQAAMAVELGRSGLADRATVFEVAARAAAGSGFSSLPLIVLDVPLGSVVERELFARIVAAASSAFIALHPDDEAMVAAIEAMGKTPVPIAEPPDDGLATFRARLFGGAPRGEPLASGAVTLTSAPDEILETVEVARHLLEEAARGVPFEDMAVAVPPAYAAHLEATLTRGGIPALFESGTRRPHPAGRAFLTLLACRAERGSGRRLLEYLGSAQLPSVRANEGDDLAVEPGSEIEATPAPVRLPMRRWERVLGEIGLVAAGDGASVRAYVGRRLAAARAMLEAAAKATRREDVEPADTRTLAQLADLDALGIAIDPVLEALDAVPLRAPWREHLEAMARLAPVAVRRPALVLAALAELDIFADDTVMVDLSFVVAVLTPRLRNLESPMPRSEGRVLVTRPEALRGRSRRVVFILGLAERVFPERLREDPLLLDAARERIDPALARRADRSAASRASLRIATCAATERVFASFPRGDASLGRPRVASLYALEIARAMRGDLPDLDDLDRLTREGKSGARLAWPAPTRPERAIDAIEYELGLLPNLVRGLALGERGRARFMLSRHPHLDRALRAAWFRAKPDLGSADGLVLESGPARELLDRRSLKERAYSPSALESYATCPYRFYLRAIMRVLPRDEAAPVERLEPLARGNLYHRVQAELARRLGAEQTSASQSPARAKDLVRAILKEEAALTFAAIDPLVPAVFEQSVDLLLRDLLGWVDEEVKRADGFVPFAAELPFGVSVPHEGGLPVRGGFLLRGAIDAVDRHPDGRVRVTDYKTGRVYEDLGGLDVVGRGQVLQPILYSLAIEAMKGGAIPANAYLDRARLYFATEQGGYADIGMELTERRLQEGESALGAIDFAIRKGVLAPAPAKDACERCDYRAICGDGEPTRMAKKRTRPGSPASEVGARLSRLRGRL